MTGVRELAILGPIEAHAEGRLAALGGPRQRALLAVLALARGRPLAADTLAEWVWSSAPPPSSEVTLRSYVSRLRGLLGSDAIESGTVGYRLALATDADRFEALLAEATALPTGTARVAGLRAALALWRGAPCEDAAGALAAHPEIARLEELRLEAIEDRIETQLALGQLDGLVAELELLLDEEPQRERLWAALMVALYETGRQADALAAYRRARQALDELGIEPSLRLRELETQILKQSLAGRVTRARAGVPLPVPLTPFVGRRADVAAALHQLGSARLLTLTGVGGAGKTRLAIEAARRSADSWPGGVFFADLARVEHGAEVATAIGEAAGVDPGAADRVAALTERLGDEPALLVLGS
jgi:DNA-binding SARP family transcriptional activator